MHGYVTFPFHLEMNQTCAHNDTELLVGLHADADHVADVDAAQQPEEAGLTVLMAGEQLPVGHHQAAGDAGGGGHALGDDLQARRPQGSITAHNTTH